jgi:peptidoglycan/LPS O-acetylase OafA/YrhL
MFGALEVTVIALVLGFSVYTIVNGVAGKGNRRGAPPLLRGLMLVWLAISLAVLVLESLDGFPHGDHVFMAVVFAILALLAVLGRGRKQVRE